MAVVDADVIVSVNQLSSATHLKLSALTNKIKAIPFSATALKKLIIMSFKHVLFPSAPKQGFTFTNFNDCNHIQLSICPPIAKLHFFSLLDKKLNACELADFLNP